MYETCVEEIKKYKGPSLESYPVLQEFIYVFEKIQNFPPKRYNDFCIDLMLGDAPFSKIPYIMSTLELKDLQMQLEEPLKKEFINPSVSPCG